MSTLSLCMFRASCSLVGANVFVSHQLVGARDVCIAPNKHQPQIVDNYLPFECLYVSNALRSTLL